MMYICIVEATGAQSGIQYTITSNTRPTHSRAIPQIYLSWPISLMQLLHSTLGINYYELYLLWPNMNKVSWISISMCSPHTRWLARLHKYTNIHTHTHTACHKHHPFHVCLMRQCSNRTWSHRVAIHRCKQHERVPRAHVY